MNVSRGAQGPVRFLSAGLPEAVAREVRVALEDGGAHVKMSPERLGIALLMEVRESEPDVVVLPLVDGRFPSVCSHLLAEDPALRILGLDARTGVAYLHALEPKTYVLGELTPAGAASFLSRALLQCREADGPSLPDFEAECHEKR